MSEMLSLEFMRNALLAALFVGLAAPMVGTFLVQRRLSLIGDGLGHVALAGVAIGVLTGQAPVLTALVTAALAAVVLELVRVRGRTSGDVALALLFYGGIAAGVVIINRSEGAQTGNLTGYLFGAITTTSRADLVVFGMLSAVIVSVTLVLRPRLFAVAGDEEYARASGLPVLLLNILLAVLTAVTVVVAMRVIGLLLISALMIVPSAVAQLLARSFRQALYLACTIGLVVSVSGTTASYYTGTPSGGTIVLLAIALFLLVAAAVALREATARRRHRRRGDVHAAHPHEHGENCGHPPVPHDDHVDYDHDGHLHAPHQTGSGVHYDEHGEHPVAAPQPGAGGNR